VATVLIRSDGLVRQLVDVLVSGTITEVDVLADHLLAAETEEADPLLAHDVELDFDTRLAFLHQVLRRHAAEMRVEAPTEAAIRGQQKQRDVPSRLTSPQERVIHLDLGARQILHHALQGIPKRLGAFDPIEGLPILGGGHELHRTRDLPRVVHHLAALEKRFRLGHASPRSKRAQRGS
jgi:hypothetical protein